MNSKHGYKMKGSAIILEHKSGQETNTGRLVYSYSIFLGEINSKVPTIIVNILYCSDSVQLTLCVVVALILLFLVAL